jgi:CRISPR-associated protein Cmr2
MTGRDWDRRFTYAIAYCLASGAEGAPQVLRAWFDQGGSVEQADPSVQGYLAAAQWALHLREEPPAEAAGDEVALVSGGATRIKGYVFESARLPEIRGASGLLDRINLIDIPALWKTGDLDCPECVIYANGGEILAFAPAEAGQRLADEIERIYARETLVAQSVAVSHSFMLAELREGLVAAGTLDAGQQAAVQALLGYNPLENQTFGGLVALLALAKFRRREGNPDEGRSPALRALPHFQTVPFGRRCSSCERRLAVVNAGTEGEPRPLCEPCGRKRVFGQRAKREGDRVASWWDRAGFTWKPEAAEAWSGRFEEWLSEREELRRRYYGADSPDAVRAPEDLEQIARAGEPEGFIGVVYADGNNMGRLLEGLDTPSKYAEFAESVFVATQDAVFQAIAGCLHPSGVRLENGSRQWTHPFEILSIGGDDVFLVVPADAALPVACEIARRVEDVLCEHPDFRVAESYQWPEVQRCRGEAPAAQSEVSLSVGVVLAAEHTPVYYLARLAEDLLKSAKRRAKWLKRKHIYYGGTVDFLALKSVTMISGTVEQFRQGALTARHGKLYARPYTLAEMEQLLESIRALKRARFPRTQLYRLRESLDAGRGQSMVDYFYFLSRSQGVRRARREIEALWAPDGTPQPHPWRRSLGDEQSRETIWHDLVELYEFVAGEETAGEETA